MFAERFSRSVDKLIVEVIQRNQLQAYKNRTVKVCLIMRWKIYRHSTRER